MWRVFLIRWEQDHQRTYPTFLWFNAVQAKRINKLDKVHTHSGNEEFLSGEKVAGHWQY